MRAKALGYQALALTDECSMASMVLAHVAAQREQLKLLVGSQFQVQGDTSFTLIVLACNLSGYGNLCQFITQLRCSSAKGSYQLHQHSIHSQALADFLVLVSPDRRTTPAQRLALDNVVTRFGAKGRGSESVQQRGMKPNF